jgi:FAD synthase
VRYLEKMSYLERREKIVKNLKSMSNEELYYSLYLEFENFKLTFLKNPNNPSSFVNNNSAIKKIVSINVDRLINRGFIKELCIGPLSEQTVEELKWFLEANSVNISNIKIHKSSIKLN